MKVLDPNSVDVADLLGAIRDINDRLGSIESTLAMIEVRQIAVQLDGDRDDGDQQDGDQQDGDQRGWRPPA